MEQSDARRLIGIWGIKFSDLSELFSHRWLIQMGISQSGHDEWQALVSFYQKGYSILCKRDANLQRDRIWSCARPIYFKSDGSLTKGHIGMSCTKSLYNPDVGRGRVVYVVQFNSPLFALPYQSQTQMKLQFCQIILWHFVFARGGSIFYVTDRKWGHRKRGATLSWTWTYDKRSKKWEINKKSKDTYFRLQRICLFGFKLIRTQSHTKSEQHSILWRDSFFSSQNWSSFSFSRLFFIGEIKFDYRWN